MTPARFQLLEVIYDLERGAGVRSLFRAAAVALMDYSLGWRVLNALEAGGYVLVKRNGKGKPLDISITAKGEQQVIHRRAIAERSRPAKVSPWL